jgi:hypothetical protein
MQSFVRLSKNEPSSGEMERGPRQSPRGQMETLTGPVIPVSRKILANDLHIHRMKQEMRVTQQAHGMGGTE